jgi:hypothetical protein
MARSRAKGERRVDNCVYCGAVGPVTREDPIPKVLFRTLDKEMIKVPACFACNQRKSKGDRDLRNFVTLHIGGSRHPDAMAHAERMVESNQKTREWLERSLITAAPVPVPSEPDGYGLEIDFNKERIFDSLALTVRGLYYHETGEMLPPECPVDVREVPHDQFYAVLQALAPHHRVEPRVKGNLVAWWVPFFPPEGDRENAAWLIVFNDGVAFIALTGRLAEGIRQEKAEREKQRARELRRHVLMKKSLGVRGLG